MTRRLAFAFVVGIPFLWLCWFIYWSATQCVRVYFWVKK